MYVSTVFELVFPCGDDDVPTEVVPLPDRFLVRVPHASGADRATKLQKVAAALAETGDASITLVLNKTEPYKNQTYRTLADAVSLLYNELKEEDDDSDECEDDDNDDEDEPDFDEVPRAKRPKPAPKEPTPYALPTATQLTLDVVAPHLNRVRPDGAANFRPPPLRLQPNERFVVLHCVVETPEDEDED